MAVIDYDDGSRLIQNVPVFHQGDTHTCAQACVTSILNFWGYNVNYEDIIAETSNQTMTSGMTPEQIVWYFRRYNLTARSCIGSLDHLKSLVDRGLPSIVAWDERSLQHVVVVVGYNDYKELIFYIDSMDGDIIEEPYEDFLRAWNQQRANAGGFYSNNLNKLLIQVSR